MKKTFVVASFAICAALAFAPRARAGDANPFQILTGFSAKEACSCAFLVEQSDDYCKAFGQVSGFPPLTISIDHATKTVTSTFNGTARTARFTDGAGCLLDPLP